ncbi:Endonuclease V [Nitrospina gracilis 3/211]|uniref:Endonuclease V n=1 Tax=Nitrospina gracilis (strain 3/211) TaxID=1266370 RepID=M1Z080_NITG3|nr:MULTISPECIES: deoxyribonuclease V [Nitrospina]MCF8724250.1 deoxyribonuclease V [Nitrospina sp. Nb-3]CCQ91398.1 Endonuclease V [Nitrospina gracilis 3/211]
MKIHSLHRWDVTPKEAISIQKDLARHINTSVGLKISPKLIAGADISLSQSRGPAYAGVVVLDANTLEVVAEYTQRGEIDFPYVPGLLSFREAPLLLKAFEQIDPPPDLIMLDGQGIAHPRGLGLASHLGLFLDCPTVGCAKSRLIGDHREPGTKKGSHAPLKGKNGETLGSALRTREGCKPIFVSAGHKIDLASALEWVLRVSPRYRIPEPTRLAHNLVNRVRKEDQGLRATSR